MIIECLSSPSAWDFHHLDPMFMLSGSVVGFLYHIFFPIRNLHLQFLSPGTWIFILIFFHGLWKAWRAYRSEVWHRHLALRRDDAFPGVERCVDALMKQVCTLHGEDFERYKLDQQGDLQTTAGGGVLSLNPESCEQVSSSFVKCFEKRTKKGVPSCKPGWLARTSTKGCFVLRNHLKFFEQSVDLDSTSFVQQSFQRNTTAH